MELKNILSGDLMPLVSIIIPVYNSENYLYDCLNSLLSQKLDNIEIICIDDGSSDNSYNILKDFSIKDDRIVILKQKNMGAAYARNRGIKFARGKYLYFLDSDDFINENIFVKAIDKAERYEADIVIFRAMLFNSKNKEEVPIIDDFEKHSKYFSSTFSANDINEDIFNSFLIPAWNKIFNKNFIENNKLYFQNIKRSNDLLFTSKSLVVAKKIILLDNRLIYYRVCIRDNLQSGNDKTPLEFLKAIIALKLYLKDNNIFSIYKKSYYKLALDVMLYNLNSLKTLEAFNLTRKEICKKIVFIFDYNYICKLIILLLKSRTIMKFIFCLYKTMIYLNHTGIKNTLIKIRTKF